MQLSCPKCGTREIRVSSPYGLGETVKFILGLYQLRCRRCRARWETSMWSGGAWKYARCPRCYRQELTTWSLQYYHPPLGTYLKIQVGATPYRCAVCRCNFASFRPLRKKFVMRHRTQPEPETTPTLTEEAVRPSVPPVPTSHAEDLRALSEAVGPAAVQPEQKPAKPRQFSEPML